ncbi:MobA-like NTP transferase domain protein [Leptospira ryugenii]|uniref:MobA-like NTP transferase domain protein n=1 Tax=Leptospira ryugenii TaxID=1917863 RepID=A0A2P2E329_9LEPT|nr:NTP transferase domain-containing protein [Leptospira ryugenii]GBF51271.1 MobA-like NTP transferase domain protein [Leptospira ryugenii]
MKHHFFFLAAGFGKRMGDLTKYTPKPLLKIDGISFLDYSLFLANQWGAKDSWINVHYLGHKIEQHLKKFRYFPLEISNEEDEILGTAGGIRFALRNTSLSSHLVLFNPDTLLFPTDEFTLRTSLPENSKMHLYLMPTPENSNYTTFSISETGYLKIDEGNFFYIGLALLDPSVLQSLELGKYFDLSPMIKEFSEKGQLTGEQFKGSTLDLGTKELFDRYLNQNVFGHSKEKISQFVADYAID